jgi:hypothetical protein
VVLGVLALGVAPDASAIPGFGTLFGTDGNGGNLITVNTATGVGTLVGAMGAGVVPALAVDPATGTLYAGRGGGLPNLYTVNTVTGAATLVGNSGLGVAAIGAMDFRADGTLFASVNIAGDGGTGSDHLATINTATAVATVIGPFGVCMGVVIPSVGGGACSIEGMEAIAFDNAGTLWGASSQRGAAGAPGLYTINTATGAATFVAPILDGLSNPPSGGVVSLQFACDGTLYGGTARAVGSATDGGRLVTVNTATGAFSFVGAVSATGGSSLAALGFEQTCESCSPGFFKQPRHFSDWMGYTPTTKVSSVLTIPGCLSSCTYKGTSASNLTFLQALRLGAGNDLCEAAGYLYKEAVAALLNANSVNYPLSTAQIVAEVNATLASCDRAAIIAEADRLDIINNQLCTLD